MTKLLEQNWILEQCKEQKGWHSFFCCFHAEVVLSITSPAGKSKLSEEAKVGSC